MSLAREREREREREFSIQMRGIAYKEVRVY